MVRRAEERRAERRAAQLLIAQLETSQSLGETTLSPEAGRIQAPPPQAYTDECSNTNLLTETVYEYSSLQHDGDKDHFRLLYIEPASDPSEPVQSRLSHRSLQDPGSYVALSYAWGPTYSDGSYFTHKIYCDG